MSQPALADTDNFGELQSLRDVLTRIPGGVDQWRLLARLGMWNGPVHANPVEPHRYPTRFSDLEGSALTDELAFWLSEQARVLEVVGVLTALKEPLAVREKSEMAAARSRVLRAAAEAEEAAEVAVLTLEAELEARISEAQERAEAEGATPARAKAMAKTENAGLAAKIAQLRKGEKITSGTVSDRALSDPAVVQIQKVTGLVSLLLAGALGHKEAVVAVCAGLSREISYRTGMMAGRM